MSEPWFHRRIPERGEGEGYSIRSREGLVVAVVAVLLCAFSVVVPVQLGLGAWQVYFIAAAGVIITIGTLLRVIMTHSD
jgi:hypothetical protein